MASLITTGRIMVRQKALVDRAINRPTSAIIINNSGATVGIIILNNSEATVGIIILNRIKTPIRVGLIDQRIKTKTKKDKHKWKIE